MTADVLPPFPGPGIQVTGVFCKAAGGTMTAVAAGAPSPGATCVPACPGSPREGQESRNSGECVLPASFPSTPSATWSQPSPQTCSSSQGLHLNSPTLAAQVTRVKTLGCLSYRLLGEQGCYWLGTFGNPQAHLDCRVGVNGGFLHFY